MVKQILLAVCLVSASYAHAQDDAAEKNQSRNQIELSKATVAEIHGSQLAGDKVTALEAEGPVYTYVEPVRGVAGGTIWVWQSSGRPSAIMAISTMKNSRFFEIHSFSDFALDFEVFGNRWQPTPAWNGVEIPDAAPPHETESRRLSQIKQMVGRFRSTESYRNDLSKVTTMRILPQPIYRYTNPSRERDGAVFLVSRDGDPEAVLLIETFSRSDGTIGWQFMAGPLTVNIVDIYLDDQQYRLPRELGNDKPYFFLARAATADEK